MMRRDYILNAAEEFGSVLAGILGLNKEARWENASTLTSEEFQKLVGVDAAQALQLSDAELFARLIEGEPTHLAETKIFMVAALFQAIGEARAGQNQVEEGRKYHLRALELLLDAMGRTAIGDRPDFAPKIETLFAGLGDSPLPTKTHALLMRYYEQLGEFARAEDELFAIAEIESPGPELLEFGAAFYQRILSQSDAALLAGNLSRAEAQSGLAEFRAGMKSVEGGQ